MILPDFIRAVPAGRAGGPRERVGSHAMWCAQVLAIFFSFHEAVSLPPHSHGAQWGTVLDGEIVLTRNGDTEVFGPGQSYAIGAGVVHSARVAAGSVVLDIFEEADRYPLGA